MIIYAIFGIPPGECYETLLVDKINTGSGISDITDMSEAEKIKKYLETAKGCSKVRISRVDLQAIPDFAGTINTN